MHKGRLEAFSDGVIAIIITIMVLELKVPHGSTWNDLLTLSPVFISYVLSFLYVGIYWNNHHHLLQTVKAVNGSVLWANLHLLFWLSLFPFITAWSGENHFAELPVALYGFILFMAAIAYTILTKVIISHHGENSTLALAIGSDRKGKISLLCYALGMFISFFSPMISMLLYLSVAAMWLVPDKRIEKKLVS